MRSTIPRRQYFLHASIREDRLFYLSYIFAELRRRKGRTLLTALGLAVGVGLVATVTALSKGLNNAQDEVLKPLTGVGTDMSVQRPLRVSGSGSNQTFRPGPGGGGLSASEQEELRRENGGTRFGLRNRAKPGQTFETDNFVTTDLSFPESQADKVSQLAGVEAAAPALTLNRLHVSGKVPKNAGNQQGGFAGGPGGAPGGGAPGAGGPNSITFDQSTISGVATSQPDLALVTPSQITSGTYFKAGGKRDAILSTTYAQRKKLKVGDTLDIKKKTYKIIGLAKLPLGGQSSDIYIRLGELQALSGRNGRVNVLRVRADSADAVDAVQKRIEASFAGSQVTTAKDLADKVSGSLVDAKNLSNKLGTALAIVALVAAFLIAALLTLSSINKRTRELGTLKAIGWTQRLVVRQVTGESLAQGALGGVLGALIGIAGAALITAFAPHLHATVAGATGGGGGPGPGGGFGGPFGQGQVQSGSSTVTLSAPIDIALILLAVGLALVGGLVSGAVGGARVARLRPAAALRSVE